MKILITGASGFIGSHLSEKLIEEKHIIIAIDNLSSGKKSNIKRLIKHKNFKFIKKDINKINNLHSIGKVDILIHLAALADIVPSIENPQKYYNSNVSGTIEVLEFCRKNKINKIIYSASSSCYGDKPEVPTSENEKINPKYPYAHSKYIAEELIIFWSKMYKIDYISLRLFNVYGPRHRTSSTYGAVLGVFIKQFISNHPASIVGDGTQKRDFLFIEDLTKLFCNIIKNKRKNCWNSIYNVSSGNPKSVNEFAKIIGFKKKIYLRKRPGEPKITHANISKIKKIIGWKPQISLKKGLEIIMKNKEEWIKAPLWTKTKINNATKTWFKYVK